MSSVSTLNNLRSSNFVRLAQQLFPIWGTIRELLNEGKQERCCRWVASLGCLERLEGSVSAAPSPEEPCPAALCCADAQFDVQPILETAMCDTLRLNFCF